MPPLSSVGQQGLRKADAILHSTDASKGMVDKVEPWLVGEKSAAYLQNLDLYRPGSRKRRLGVNSIGGRSDGNPSGMWRARTVLNTERVFAIWNGKVYAMQGGGDLSQKASGVSCVNALHMANEGRWGSRVAVYICQAMPQDSNASLASNIFAIQDAADTASQCASFSPYCMTWFQDRLWIAGNTQALGTEDLWWSTLDDGLSFSANNTIRVEPGVGGRITALRQFGVLTNDLVIFKQRGIFVFTPAWGTSGAIIPSAGDALDLVNSNLRTLSAQTGCVASRSVQQISSAPGQGDLIFLSLEGFRTIERSPFGALLPPSYPISDHILTTIRRINFAWVHKATSAVIGPLYLCSVPLDGATDNTHTLVYDFINGGWSVYTWAARDFATSVLNQNADTLYMQNIARTTDSGVTGTFDGFHAFQCLTGNLDPSNSAVNFQEDTRAFVPAEDLQVKKNWVKALFTVKNEAGATGALTILYNIDQAGWVTAGSLYFPGVNNLVTLAVTPLPWTSATSKLSTRYLSLADAPPGYEIQLRYLSTDTYALPSVVDIGLWGSPIGYEMDNSIG